MKNHRETNVFINTAAHTFLHIYAKLEPRNFDNSSIVQR